MDSFYVYRHIRLDTRRPFYVGKGHNTRAYDSKGRNSRWVNIVNKHGYLVEIVASGLTEADAFKVEKKFIKIYKAFQMCEANFTDGGEGLTNPTQEVRDKISKTLTGFKHTLENRQKRSSKMMGHLGYTKGMKMSKESSLKKSEFMKNSMTNCKPIKCLNTGEVFKSLIDAVEKLQLSGTSNLSRVLKGTRSHINGLRFEYV